MAFYPVILGIKRSRLKCATVQLDALIVLYVLAAFSILKVFVSEISDCCGCGHCYKLAGKACQLGCPKIVLDHVYIIYFLLYMCSP